MVYNIHKCIKSFKQNDLSYNNKSSEISYIFLMNNSSLMRLGLVTALLIIVERFSWLIQFEKKLVP